MPTYHLLIKGKVQGVYYRASAREKGEEMGVKGWVKNTPDGNVEAVVSGEEEAVDAFIAWCKKGPERAKVSEVIRTKIQEKLFSTFEVKR